MIFALPTLYGKTSRGSLKEWSIAVTGDTTEATIKITHGLATGKKQITTRTITRGKNLGKSSETSVWEQACSEATSRWKKQLDKNYVEDPSGPTVNRKLPMLAQNYRTRGDAIKFPALVQPKLNGIRCLATVTSFNEVEYTSRRGKVLTVLDHLTPEIKLCFPEGAIIDGELYSDELTFEQIASAVKRKTPNDLTKKIEFHIFDVVKEYISFLERNRRLKKLLQGCQKPLVYVQTEYCKDRDELKTLHKKYVQAGYEGIIIRNTSGLYTFEHRSPDLQKYKDFIDEEFTIKGSHEGTGDAAGTIIFECVTSEGKLFSVRPKGSQEQLAEWWKNREQLKGKKLTVRFQNYSSEGIPIFPVGIALRDYE